MAWPLKFVSGATPGKRPTLPITEDMKRAKREKYDRERRPDRSFSNKWKEGRDWLVYDVNDNKMTCSLCSRYFSATNAPKSQINLKNRNLFISGCSNFRLSSVIDHEKSKCHQDSITRQHAEVNPKKTPAYNSLLSLNEHKRKQLEHKFRNVHAVVMSNRPFSDYVWLNELDKCKGIDKGDTYNNEKAAFIFLQSIADVERDKNVVTIQNVKFFSLTMDGSTDDASVEQETLFLRFCHRGKVQHKFIAIGEPETTCSEDLYNFVIEQLRSKNLLDQMNKCVGFGSDGASNMTGLRNGLISRLKEDYPYIIGIHCLAHRLELSFKDAIKKNNTIYDKLVTLLLGIYYFYKRSPLQRKGLRKTFQVCH